MQKPPPAGAASPAELKTFVQASAHLTGFTNFDLYGTGVVEEYWHQLATHLDSKHLDELVKAVGVADEPTARAEITKLGTELHHRAAMIIIVHMWYTGVWPELPPKLKAAVQANVDSPFVVSAEANRQGLVWRAINSHAPGSAPPGYGSWAEKPPDIPTT